MKVQRRAAFGLGAAVLIGALANVALLGGNQAPVIDPPFVYRAYPGYPIALAIPATDPDGDGLSFAALELPDGATLDEVTGILAWTPTEGQEGAYTIDVTATDDALSPLASDGTLVIQVAVLDPCTVPSCDPALGCEHDVLSIDQACCVDEPIVRVPEPALSCPEGSFLGLGRNFTSFGRMQNCDLARVTIFGQGDKAFLFHVETRCLNTSAPVTVETRFEIPDHLLVPSVFHTGTTEVLLEDRGDGFHQALALTFALPRDESVTTEDLDGAEAILDVRVTDIDGVTVEETLRLTLTTINTRLAELPNPDVIDDVPASEAGCVGCHRPQNQEGVREGIEDIHPWAELSCVDCHGGDPSESVRLDAHVDSGGLNSLTVKRYTSDELDAVPLDFLRFLNPGDLRVVDQTCGVAGCHPAHAANVKLSTMSTFGGHYTLPRYLAGTQGREALVGAVDVTDPDFDAETAPHGAVESLAALRGASPEADRATISAMIDDYLPKACPTCHLNSNGTLTTGAFRSGGCSACHLVYGDSGRSESNDPVISKTFPKHPLKHEITTAIPTEQCARCHFQGGRIGLSYRGIREGGFDADKTPEHAVPYPQHIYGHALGFYFTDEDSTNDIDETPPDLHHEAGMACVDCHVGGDVHGDGNLYVSERYQVGIRCEDCHGTVRARVSPNTDGDYTNSHGDVLKRLTQHSSGAMLLDLASGEKTLLVPQVFDLLQAGFNEKMVEAMGVREDGTSHTDSMECYTCHNTWRPSCFGCHVTTNDQGSQLNATTGQVEVGQVEATRQDYSTEFFAMGMNQRGKLSPLCPSMTMFFSYIDENGVKQIDKQIRTTADGKKGFGWNPFHHHTVQKKPLGCEQCHPVSAGWEGPDNTKLLDAAYGFGAGEIIATDGDGVQHDLTQIIDQEGNLVAAFPHPDTGPVPAEMRERAMAVSIPEPRALALEAAALSALIAAAALRRRAL